jgi:hypothetical protein
MAAIMFLQVTENETNSVGGCCCCCQRISQARDQHEARSKIVCDMYLSNMG